VCERRPTPEVLWFADDQDRPIAASSRYVFDVNNRSLTINDAQPSDERLYRCQATNTEATAEAVYQQVRVAGQLIVTVFNR